MSNMDFLLRPYQFELLKLMQERESVIMDVYTKPSGIVQPEKYSVEWDSPSLRGLPVLITDSLGSFKASDDATNYVTRYGVGIKWPSYTNLARKRNQESPQEPTWRLKQTLRNSTQSGTSSTVKSPAKNRVQPSYLSSPVLQEGKASDSHPWLLQVARPPQKKFTGTPGTKSKAWR